MRGDPVPPGHEAAPATEIHYHAHHRVASVPWLCSAQLCTLDTGSLPEGRHDLTNLERIPGVLPFEVYAHAPLRLISWCSFELNQVARRLLRDLAVLCEEPTTTTKDLVDRIALRNTHVQDEQDATQYLATLATVHIASRAQMPTYTTMVQHFLGTLQLPMAIYMLDYYLPMLSPNEGYNETGLTMQSAGPIREPWQPVEFEFSI